MRIIHTVLCCKCGSSNLEMCYASKALGPHLCPLCAKTWQKIRTRFLMKRQPAA